MTAAQRGYTLAESAPANYERFFVPAIGEPVAAGLLEKARLRPGERVLDVACGTGVVTRLAADAVGTEGEVSGLDVNPGMLAVAREIAPAEKAISWHQASAESMPLPDESFDVVTCQMGLQFIPDKLQALREMRRVLVDGGRVILDVPGPIASTFEVLAESMRQHIDPSAAGFVRQVFSLDDPHELRALLEQAGFRDVEVETDTITLTVPPPRDFLWQYVSSTPLAETVARAGDGARAALERDVVERWRELETDDGMSWRQGMLTARGRR